MTQDDRQAPPDTRPDRPTRLVYVSGLLTALMFISIGVPNIDDRISPVTSLVVLLMMIVWVVAITLISRSKHFRLSKTDRISSVLFQIFTLGFLVLWCL